MIPIHNNRNRRLDAESGVSSCPVWSDSGRRVTAGGFLDAR